MVPNHEEISNYQIYCYDLHHSWHLVDWQWLAFAQITSVGVLKFAKYWIWFLALSQYYFLMPCKFASAGSLVNGSHGLTVFLRRMALIYLCFASSVGLLNCCKYMLGSIFALALISWKCCPGMEIWSWTSTLQTNLCET